jgi:hypothetical protein
MATGVSAAAGPSAISAPVVTTISATCLAIPFTAANPAAARASPASEAGAARWNSW